LDLPDDDVVVSVDAVLFVEDDWSLLMPLEPLVVPLAPMLDVLGLVELLAVLPLVELLGLVELLYELLGVVLVEPVALLLLVSLVDEAVVPPEALEPLVPDVPLDCAIAKPPMASAAAAANVVSVFLVVVMSFAP
jgi:hypothetical protein